MATRAGAAEIFEEMADDLNWTRAKQISVLIDFIEAQDLAGDLQDYLNEMLEAEDDEEETTDREDVDVDLYSTDDD
jgi:hypothetical protein